MHKCQACEAAEGFFQAFDCTYYLMLQHFFFTCVLCHTWVLSFLMLETLILLVLLHFFPICLHSKICLAPFFS